jgi:hypothetical protein
VRKPNKIGVPTVFVFYGQERVEAALHRTRNIFDRYNIVNDADLAAAQERQQVYLATQKQAPTVKPMAQAGK